MTKKGILPLFVSVINLLLYFLPVIVNAETGENIDFPHLRSRKNDETYQIYRNPQNIQADSSYNIRAEDDITKNDSLVLFDKSKPKTAQPEKIKSDEYIAPQRFEISQTNQNDSNRIHGIKQQESFDPVSKNQISQSDLNLENKYDNFGDRYQQWNESLYHQAQNNEKVDTRNPYPPLPAKHKDPEPEYFPPSFTQNLSQVPESAESNKEKSFSISSSLRDSTRTTVAPNTSNRNVEDITSPEMEDYDKNGMLAKGEEIQYSDDPPPLRQTYSTEGIKRDPTMPFKVTHSLMDALGSTTLPTTYLQDSEATIYPTLVPGTVDEEEQQGVEDDRGEKKEEEEEEAMITSDYISNMDPSQRDRMFSRDHLQPWERHRNEMLENENRVEEKNEENLKQNEQQNYPTYSTSYNGLETSTTPYLTSYVVPASTIYTAPAPPLSSYILVPSGTKYYGDQAPKVQVVSDSSYDRIYDEESDHQNGYKISQHKISRENVVTVEKVEDDENGGSDLSRSPQFKLYGIKTAFHKSSGSTETNETKVEKYDTWLANPATIFDLPLPTILKTAFAVNTNALAAKQYSDNSKLDEFEMDESGNPLKYRKKGTGRSTEISISPLRELPDFQVISGGSNEVNDDPEIETFVDEAALAAAKKDSCQPSELTNIESEGDEILSQCFVIAKNCLLTNAAPIERRINLNLTECATFCAENHYCKSLGYSETMAICDIFAFLNGTSDSSLIRYRGTHYLQPTRKNIKTCLQDRRLSGITVVASNDPIGIDSRELSEEQLLSLTSKVNPNVKLNNCPIDTDILTLKTENYRLRNFGIDKFIQDPPNSESECIFSCLIDLANGRLPFNCTSASYNSKTNECTLYSGGSNVNGNGHLIEEHNYEHYEKVCADDKLVQQCRGFPVARIPQKLLMGFVVARERAYSLLECITLCFERFKNHGDCLSVNYFYTEENENCILSSESYLTIPQFFIDEVESIVDHASIDKCLQVKENLAHVSTNGRIPQKSLAIDIEDGSRILPSTPGFDIVPTIDEKSFKANAIDGDTLLLSSNDGIRRHPINLHKITTTPSAPEVERLKLTNQLKKSIKKLKV